MRWRHLERDFRVWWWNLSRRGVLRDFANFVAQLPLGVPQIVGHLHAKPEAGTVAAKSPEAHRHLRRALSQPDPHPTPCTPAPRTRRRPLDQRRGVRGSRGGGREVHSRNNNTIRRAAAIQKNELAFVKLSSLICGPAVTARYLVPRQSRLLSEPLSALKGLTTRTPRRI
jgi:hypothetical protein